MLEVENRKTEDRRPKAYFWPVSFSCLVKSDIFIMQDIIDTPLVEPPILQAKTQL